MKSFIRLLVLALLIAVYTPASADIWDQNAVRDNGVPQSYKGVAASGETFAIQKGQLNKLKLRPQIINEHAESSRNIIGVVTTTNIVGQIFRASQDNINGINLTLESAAGIEFDNFESYADSAALQVEWVATNAAKKAELETTVVHGGTKSMELPTSGSVGDEWGRDFATTDFTGYTGQFYMYATNTVGLQAASVYVRDSIGNSNSAPIVTVGSNQWDKYIFETASLVADDVTPADLTDIVEIGFRVTNTQPNSLMYFDDLVSVPGPGSVELKLWDMGATMPVSAVDALDDGTQYEKLGDAGISGIQASSVILQLLGGKRMYHIDRFVAGPALEIPANELLTIGNYYAITVDYIDTDTSVYGPNATIEDYYINGYSFTAPDESTAITATGSDEDLMFIVFSTQDIYINQFLQFIDAAPNGGSLTSIFVEDSNMKIPVDGNIVSGVSGQQSVIQFMPRPIFMEKGGKFEQYYNDDFTDSVSSISLTFQYYFIPEMANN